MDDIEQALRSKALRVSLDRLVKFDCVWTYADGLWSGVVWVKPPIGGVDKAKPCWYRCVGENTRGLHDDWHRKFVLYDMTMEQLENARRHSEIKAIAINGHVPYLHQKNGIRMPLTASEAAALDGLVNSLGPEIVSDLWQRVHDIKANQVLRSNTIVGWFQR